MPVDDDEGLESPRWMRQMKAMQDLVNPPWLRQMQALQDAVNPPWLRQMQALQDAAKPPWLRQMQAFQEPIAPRLRETMTLGASAALLTRSVLPGVGRDFISAALFSVTSSILGRSVESIARAFPSRSTLAAEALSALAGLKLQGPTSQFLSTDNTLLVSSLASLQGAIDTSQSQEELSNGSPTQSKKLFKSSLRCVGGPAARRSTFPRWSVFCPSSSVSLHCVYLTCKFAMQS